MAAGFAAIAARSWLADSIHFHGFPLAGIDPMTATTGRSFPRHTHDQYGIGVVDSGGHRSWSDCGQVEAGPGDFICVNPAEVHDGRAIGHEGRSWRMFYFDPALLAAIGTDLFERGRSTFTFAEPVFADRSLHRLFDRTFEFTRSSAAPANRMACETAVIKLIARLCGHSTWSWSPGTGATPDIRRARERIDADPAAPLTLTGLAQEVGLSRFQLIRGFTRELKLTPHAYILQQRIALARRLICSGHPLAEVAAAAGFYDQSHLTRCFVRQYGVTPRRYGSRAR
jgi:AraC-like DNA-binding protein